jgi:hypothetical protein
VRLGARAFDANPEARHLETALAPAEAAAALGAHFRGRRYRVATAAEGEAVYLYADRNRYAPLGTFVSHAGLILLFVGGLMRSFFGFHLDGFGIPDGSTRALGFGTAITIENKGFVEIDDPRTGMPIDFYSDLVLYDNGVEKVRQRIRVNDPLGYNGIDFHQAFFGQAAVVRIADAAGREVFADGVPLAYKNQVRYGERPFGFVALDSSGATFGRAAVVRVVDTNGKALHNGGVPLVSGEGSRYGDRPAGTITLLEGRLVIDVVKGAAGDPDLAEGETAALLFQGGASEPFAVRKLRPGQAESVGGMQITLEREEPLRGRLLVDLVGGTPGDPEIAPGEVVALVYLVGNGRPFAVRKLRLGQTESVGGLALTFERERMFTGLQVEKNPGVPVLFVAAFLMLAGWGAVFYFPHRRLWALVRPDGNGGSRVGLIALAKREPGGRRFFDREWEGITEKFGVRSSEFGVPGTRPHPNPLPEGEGTGALPQVEGIDRELQNMSRR